ncbi:MAG: putative toxin-antitoxin system toxin component, PIN family [Segetibacter sp.]|nr:putative toxin-antitoxin system toxin component, PIN family [Segetibacter sp.]
MSSRVIVDTNLWISYLISATVDPLLPLIKAGKVTLLFSEELMAEFIAVATRPRFSKYFTSNDVTEIVQIFNTLAEWIPVVSNIKICRDPKDNYLLSLAKDGKADFLITGDNDLLVIEKIEETVICSFTQFLELV